MTATATATEYKVDLTPIKDSLNSVLTIRGAAEEMDYNYQKKFHPNSWEDSGYSISKDSNKYNVVIKVGGDVDLDKAVRNRGFELVSTDPNLPHLNLTCCVAKRISYNWGV